MKTLQEWQRILETMMTPVGEKAMPEMLLPLLLSKQMPTMPAGMIADDATDDERKEREQLYYSSRVSELVRLLAHYPKDILAKAIDDNARASVFFPMPADINKHAEPLLEKRQRMRGRIQLLLMSNGRPQAKTFEAEPEEVRLRGAIWIGWKYRGTFTSSITWPSACRAEIRLAEIENREPAEWAKQSGPQTVTPPMKRQGRPAQPSQPITDVVAEPVEPWNAGQPVYQQRQEEPPPPSPRDVIEAEDFGA